MDWSRERIVVEAAVVRRGRTGRARTGAWAATGWVGGWILLLGLVLAPGWTGGQAAGQAAVRAPEHLKVFLDCQTRGCPRQEFRTEIGFVDWVNERTASDIHVILTSQRTGAGTQYVFDFIGQGQAPGGFAGLDLRLEETSLDTDTRDEVLAGLVRTFEAGLVPYVARRGYLDELDIRAVRPDGVRPEEPAVPADDPWNLWVFSVGVNGEAEGEEQQRSYELGSRLSASRVTPDWKIDFDFDGQYEFEEYELSGGAEDYTTVSWRGDVLVVKSLSEHWSAGGLAEVSRSTQYNRELGGRAAAALEWDLYPYREANRRQLLLHYQVGVSRVKYEQLTLFGETQETLFDHRLVALYETRQPWGNVEFSAAWSNYLHDWSKYSIATNLGASFRLFRGLELDVRGRYEVIHDQLYLSAEELSDEEILVQRRQLATGYEYGVDVGLRYRFGSIYNSVVNNRFPWRVMGF